MLCHTPAALKKQKKKKADKMEENGIIAKVDKLQHR